MNELIKIREENGKQLVSARDLHEFLEVTERFQQWFNKRIQKYGFEEGEDYIGCKIFHTLAKQELQDYAITIEMAKELSMVQNNDKGKEARKYFISCEKKLKEMISPKLPTTYKEALIELLVQVEKNEKLELENAQQKQQIGELKPKADYTDIILKSKNTLSITQIAKDYGMSG